MLPKGYLEVMNGHSFDFDSDDIQLTLSKILDTVLSMIVKTTVINLVYLSNKDPDSAINIIYDNVSRYVNVSKVNARSEIKNTKPFLTLKIIDGM
jgi:riboflavin synthase alpha subunit